MLLCSVATLRCLTGSRPCTEVKDKGFYALVNIGSPLSDRQENDLSQYMCSMPSELLSFGVWADLLS